MTALLSTVLPLPKAVAAVCLAQAADRPEPPFALQYLPLIAIAAAAYLLLFRPERERMKKQQELLGHLRNGRQCRSGRGPGDAQDRRIIERKTHRDALEPGEGVA